MSLSVNAQACSYVRSLFEYPSKWYESFQENGTKYLKSRKQLSYELQQQLNCCAGEIFLCGIPPDAQAEKIAEVASLLGEMYILRFKVHFSGASRGFAYLQYIDASIMTLALEKLPQLFRMFHYPTIKVCTSRNSSVLLLRKSNLAPVPMAEALKQFIKFQKLEGYELSPGYFEYRIVFNCNEVAVHARRDIMKCILKFGPKAMVVWDAAGRNGEKIGFRTLNKTLNKTFHNRHHPNLFKINLLGTVPNTANGNWTHRKSLSNDFVSNFRTMKL